MFFFKLLGLNRHKAEIEELFRCKPADAVKSKCVASVKTTGQNSDRFAFIVPIPFLSIPCVVHFPVYSLICCLVAAPRNK